MTEATAAGRFSVGAQLFLSGNHLAAERLCGETIALDPMHDFAYALLALSLCNLGRPRDALEAADTAIRIKPRPDAFRARALALVALRRPREAVPAAREAVAVAPTNGVVAYTLAWALESAKQPTEAGEYYKRATELAPENLMLRAEYARFLLRRWRIDEAEVIASDIRHDVEINAVAILRGEVALLRGRPDEAREFAMWVLSRNARNRQGIILLTVATANRNPILAVWWHYAYGLRSRPIWQRILVLFLFIGIGMLIFALPLVFCISLVLARAHVNRLVQDELKGVQLKKAF